MSDNQQTPRPSEPTKPPPPTAADMIKDLRESDPLRGIRR